MGVHDDPKMLNDAFMVFFHISEISKIPLVNVSF